MERFLAVASTPNCRNLFGCLERNFGLELSYLFFFQLKNDEWVVVKPFPICKRDRSKLYHYEPYNNIINISIVIVPQSRSEKFLKNTGHEA